jgi:hypothetical protein
MKPDAQTFAGQVQDEHEIIARAIEAGDPAMARQAASRHMDNAIQRIEQADPSFWQQAGVQLAQPLVRGLASKGLSLGPSPARSFNHHSPG